MKLKEYIPDTRKLSEYVAEGIVSIRMHNTLPLAILCYTKRATYENIWDEITCKTRGLIVATLEPDMGEAEIIARPFEKFFNFETAGRPETSAEYLHALDYKEAQVQDKLDGSLGIYWEYPTIDGPVRGIATKGSFHSEQAEWATQWLQTYDAPLFWGSYTPLFEIINQDIQHHVVHYEPSRDKRLVVLGLVHKETGAEAVASEVDNFARFNGFEVVTTTAQHQFIGPSLPYLIRALKSIPRPNHEGYVVSLLQEKKPSVKIKIKHDEFLRLQKIAHHTTPKVVFEYVRDGRYEEINTVIRDASPYLSELVKEWVTNYQDKYDEIYKQASTVAADMLVRFTTRKEQAAHILQWYPSYSDVTFAILDLEDAPQSESYKAKIWKHVGNIVGAQRHSEVEEEA